MSDVSPVGSASSSPVSTSSFASTGTTDAPKNPNASAPNADVPPGLASTSSQRLQHLEREINTTLEKYAEYAGVKLRPAHGPTGWSINANVLISKLAEIAAYHPDAANVLENLKQDLATIGKDANLNFNVRDDKGVPLNHGNKAFDPQLAKAVKEIYRSEQREQLWGNNKPEDDTEKPGGSANSTEPKSTQFETLLRHSPELRGEYLEHLWPMKDGELLRKEPSPLPQSERKVW